MVKRLDPAAEGGSKRSKPKEASKVMLPNLPRVQRNDPEIIEAGMGSARKAAVEAARKLMQGRKAGAKNYEVSATKLSKKLKERYNDFMDSMQKKHMGKHNWRDLRGRRDRTKGGEYERLRRSFQDASLDANMYPGAPKKIIEAMHFGKKSPRLAKANLREKRKIFEEAVGIKFRDYMRAADAGKNVEKFSDGIQKFINMAID